MKKYYVYILSNRRRTVYYTGVSNDFKRRFHEHKSGCGSQFCKKYNINELVYFEELTDINYAIMREKKIKKLSKVNKLKLISKINPGNEDLSLKYKL